MSSNQGIKGLFYKNSKLQPAGLIALLAIFVVGAWAIRQYIDIDSKGSSANCYGTNCQPTVTIGGRIAGGGYGTGISYGTMYVDSGSVIDLTWFGENVDRCEAIDRWTRFRGTYMEPTLYPQKITQSQNFGVKCQKGRAKVEAYFSVIVNDTKK